VISRRISAAQEYKLRGTLRAKKEPLIAADVLLTDKKFEAATAEYAGIVSDTKISPGQRLAAWEGYMDATPAKALLLGKEMLALAANMPFEMRRPC